MYISIQLTGGSGEARLFTRNTMCGYLLPSLHPFTTLKHPVEIDYFFPASTFTIAKEGQNRWKPWLVCSVFPSMQPQVVSKNGLQGILFPNCLHLKLVAPLDLLPHSAFFFSTLKCLGGSGTSCIPSFVFDVTSKIKIIRYTVQIIIIRNEVLERRKKESMYSC